MTNWKKKDESQPQQKAWTPSMKEADALSEKLKGFKKTQIQLYTYYPLQMLMLKEGIVGTDPKFGAMIVRSPERYKQLQDTYELMQWRQQKDNELLFASFPEEKVAHDSRIADIVKSLRDIVINTSVPAVRQLGVQ